MPSKLIGVPPVSVRSPYLWAVAAVALLPFGTAPTLASSLVAEGPPNEDVVALSEGGIEAALDALPGYIADVMEESGVPGLAVAVVHGGETIVAEGYGVRETGRDDPIDAETVFQIASISKSLAATVAAVQVTNGVLDWDDPAITHLDGLRLNDPYVTANATVGDFFAHRSGLPATVGDELEDLGFSRSDIIERLAQVPLEPFRTSFNYSNFGYTIGAEAVAAAAGSDWETLSETALYQPLGMTSTSSRHDDLRSRENRATLHALEGGEFSPLYERDADQQSPAGGVSSNVVDLAEWLKLILADGRHGDDQLVAPEALMPALRPQSFSAPAHNPNARSGFYGYGFNSGVTASGRTVMSHSGAFLLGAGTHVTFIPSADIGIVVLTNAAPVGLAEAVGAQFMDIVQFGAVSRNWSTAYRGAMAFLHEPAGDLASDVEPPLPETGRELSAYVGSYHSDYFGPADIALEDGDLVLTLGPRGDRFPLEAWDTDTFAFSPVNENAPRGSRFSIRFSAEGGESISGFAIPSLSDQGLATWVPD